MVDEKTSQENDAIDIESVRKEFQAKAEEKARVAKNVMLNLSQAATSLAEIAGSQFPNANSWSGRVWIDGFEDIADDILDSLDGLYLNQMFDLFLAPLVLPAEVSEFEAFVQEKIEEYKNRPTSHYKHDGPTASHIWEMRPHLDPVGVEGYRPVEFDLENEKEYEFFAPITQFSSQFRQSYFLMSLHGNNSRTTQTLDTLLECLQVYCGIPCQVAVGSFVSIPVVEKSFDGSVAVVAPVYADSNVGTKNPVGLAIAVARYEDIAGWLSGGGLNPRISGTGGNGLDFVFRNLANDTEAQAYRLEEHYGGCIYGTTYEVEVGDRDDYHGFWYDVPLIGEGMTPVGGSGEHWMSIYPNNQFFESRGIEMPRNATQTKAIETETEKQEKKNKKKERRRKKKAKKDAEEKKAKIEDRERRKAEKAERKRKAAERAERKRSKAKRKEDEKAKKEEDEKLKQEERERKKEERKRKKEKRERKKANKENTTPSPAPPAPTVPAQTGNENIPNGIQTRRIEALQDNIRIKGIETLPNTGMLVFLAAIMCVYIWRKSNNAFRTSATAANETTSVSYLTA